MVKTFTINAYYGNNTDMFEHIYIDFVCENESWVMHICKKHNDSSTRFENIKLSEVINYDFVIHVLNVIRTPGFVEVETKVGFTNKKLHPCIAYKMTTFDIRTFDSLLESIEEYGDIDTMWFSNNDKDFRNLYPRLLK